jgi:hypothetical protein
MNELMLILKDEGVFYVDSRTTAATVAFDAAKHAGVRTAFRNVPFLDDVQNPEAVKRQLQLAIQGAKRKGEAIAIGHPHSATLAALREILPQAKKDGVQLVVRVRTGPLSDGQSGWRIFRGYHNACLAGKNLVNIKRGHGHGDETEHAALRPTVPA